MSQLGGLHGISPLFGKPALPAAVVVLARAPAAVALTARAVPATGAAERARPTADDSAAAAARTLAAAVRAAALREASATPRAAEDGDDPPRRSGALEASVLMARLTSGSGLPVLPEPPTPAREAFVEAVLALRSGITRQGATAGLSGRA